MTFAHDLSAVPLMVAPSSRRKTTSALQQRGRGKSTSALYVARGADVTRVQRARSCVLPAAQQNFAVASHYNAIDHSLVLAHGASYAILSQGVSRSSLAFARVLVHALERVCAALSSSARPLNEATVTSVVGVAIASARTAFRGHDMAAEASLSVAFAHPETHKLFVYTLGRAKVLVVRDRAIVFESSSVLHGFHTPARVCASPDADPQVGRTEAFQLAPNDTALLVSASIADTLFADEIAAASPRELVHRCTQRTMSLMPHTTPLAARAAAMYAQLTQRENAAATSRPLLGRAHYVAPFAPIDLSQIHALATTPRVLDDVACIALTLPAMQ
ncbi:hypothetical protein SPRG_17463 [Saprolegnia parasitica CBS 223.65]|uniref:PPM-type phosphatase domain-containing protein n=1 Tax=Saprolegnia parasitica (strain CBS 223.65) TaxID=695850 RepID=A0A067BG50_SAPPC|nr:hypothetical protein SPRG_17463 [Saprolegnia parasitica CBS 223.65]KDO17128.1 hypothetical protein SPRG_17463 [Saprolegnia parasitica CBS 223.65]|eukprot:XP_012212166.1 hypothetical protein SPRG_17463 [Saprolegnia parasitica CBS 223.65]